jgi:hypothetical protein
MSKGLHDGRRQYRKEYQSNYRKEHTRLEIALTEAQDRRLSEAAERHHIKRSAFVRKAAFSYLDRRYIVPDPELVRNLELSIRRIGTNLNQIARHESQSPLASTLSRQSFRPQCLHCSMVGAFY